MRVFILALSFCLLSSFSTYAAKPKNYYQPKTYSYTSNIVNSSDQERCEAEANYMAQNNITGHVWGTIGNFEGIGYGHSPNCNTCVPNSNMRLTGDASVCGKNGMWYRVRSWR